jgi:hypothetical protein
VQLAKWAVAKGSDIVLMTDRLEQLEYAIRLSRRSGRIVNQNIAILPLCIGDCRTISGNKSGVGVAKRIISIYHQLNLFKKVAACSCSESNHAHLCFCKLNQLVSIYK